MAEGANDHIPSASAVNAIDAGKERHRQIRRRNRIISSCLPCRQRKIRCDKLNPCTNCKKFSRSCLYIAPALDTVAQQELAELKDKLSSLEESLGRDVAQRAGHSDPAQRNASTTRRESAETDDEDDESQEPEDAKDLEPTPLASFDSLYGEDADDELMDLGIQMGKLRVSDRIGGLARPRIVDELQAILGESGQDRNNQRQHVFLPGFVHSNRYNGWPQQSTVPEAYLAPGPDYVPPSSNFFFPDSIVPSADFIPSRGVSDQLVAQYFLAVHPIARIVHRPTLEAQYMLFLDHLTRGTVPPAPIQALISAVMFSAAVSLSEDLAAQLSGIPKSMLIARLRGTTELCLSRAHVLRTTRIDTLQAFVVYMLPLCRNEISRGHSAMVGAAIRLAQCMGLHRDGSFYGLSAVDTHVRRLIWYQLCFLDIRTCEVTGPRPQIRRDEYDTKIPLNVNDEDLMGSVQPTTDSNTWTDMTLTKMKIECYDLVRQLWDDMQRIDQKKTTLTATLGKIQRFRASTGAKYAALTQGNNPLQLLTRHIYRALSNRCFVLLLQRYALSTVHPMPDRLRQILIEAAVCAVEAGMAMDTQHELRSWSWYRGALAQYTACLLLLFDIYKRPDIKEASRVWNCIDYVFELQPQVPRQQKAEGAIMELRDRLNVYNTLRKVKVSPGMGGQTGTGSPSPSHIPTSGSIMPLDGGLPNIADLTHAAAIMQPMHRGSPSGSTGSRTGLMSFQEPHSDTVMQAVTDIDWNEWEKYFPHGSQSILDNMENPPDFDMTSFNPHNSYNLLLRGNNPTR